ADYYRASGAALTIDRRWSWLRGRIGVGFEDHTSVERNTDFAIPDIWQDSVFQLNPPADEGTFWRGDAEAIIYIGASTRPTDARAQLTLGIELGSGADSLDYVQARAGLEGKFDLWDLASLALVARGGWSGGDLPLQRLWRIGGIETLRGFTHGTLAGESYWTGRIELAPVRPIWRTIVGDWRAVVFGDFGWAGDRSNWPGGGSSDDVLWSVGTGVSLLNGFFRAEFVFPELEEVRFEMHFAGAL
ncbi:MAG: BamA/TamA family outer membrane protein, partial [Gemmatimonadales bacterium]